MAYFDESMTSGQAREKFFHLADLVKADEITMQEFGKIVSEYREVSAKIIVRELRAMDADDMKWMTEETLEADNHSA